MNYIQSKLIFYHCNLLSFQATKLSLAKKKIVDYSRRVRRWCVIFGERVPQYNFTELKNARFVLRVPKKPVLSVCEILRLISREENREYPRKPSPHTVLNFTAN